MVEVCSLVASLDLQEVRECNVWPAAYLVLYIYYALSIFTNKLHVDPMQPPRL